MSEWLETTLGGVLNFQRGLDITRATQRDGSIPVVSSGGVSSYHDTAGAHGPGVVIGRKGTLGKVFYLPEDYWPHDTTLWVQDFKGSHPRFVYYFMSQFETAWLDAGSANPTLNRNHLHPLKVTWPPLAEQQAIAEVLGALDDKIAANTKLAATADELASAILHNSVHGDDTAQLSTIATITMGSSPTGETLNELGEGTVFYQGVRDFGVRFPNTRVWTTSPSRMAKSGDTLISVRAPVGRVNLANEDLCIGRGLASAQSSDGRPATLFHLLKSSSHVWEPFEAEGTVFGSINKNQLANVALPAIQLEKSANVEIKLQSIEARITKALQEIESMAATRDALLPQLMSGKLPVKDAESVVSAAV